MGSKMENKYKKDRMVDFFEGRLKEVYFNELKGYKPNKVSDFIDELKLHYDSKQEEYEMLSEYQNKLHDTRNLAFSELEEILKDVALIQFDLTEDPQYSITKEDLKEIKKDL